MATSSFSSQTDPEYDATQQYDTPSDIQSVEARWIAALETPSVPDYVGPGRATRYRTVDDGQEATTSDLGKPRFLPLAEWDEHNSYDEDIPSWLRYSIEWKVVVNNKTLSKDTEQDVVLAPSVYWRFCLRAKVDKLLSRKLPHGKHVKCDDTSVVASVNDRSERDLTKRFDDIDIDWPLVERQLMRWGELLRCGKKLRVDLSFNYVELAPPSAAARNRGNKRGSSATQNMLADRASQLDAEQETSASASVWREVYALMRCPGPPCNRGPHCWRDPLGKKHYKLQTHHLKALIQLVEEGHILHTHNDVPEDIREQLYAEEEQRRDRQAAGGGISRTNIPPITITNVLPQHPSQFPSTMSTSSALYSEERASRRVDLGIPGPRDLAVVAYSRWQQSNVADEAQKMEYQKACDITLQEMLDLEQLHEDQDYDFFIQNGVKRGVARRYVSDIGRWVELHKSTYDREQES
ncbi:hypothetical protein COCC4DRAFT_155192 [Bipolaris maydis ATCC 48331]|uniref:Uncharacterized protein n=2 Tax=Cochliobolus heterostrophus TaxID=5016 RepID=M2US39_COCH5|nr:uncharacterized protein COCC4DRAFT_155192 [Bipolaris maydis ATCC 48331]EMD96376.1 hypothetical protein COCHEDRAFT_1221912 [Bipolaris maydis C5]ENH98685.1 hypothetical protein COCC4DRAFT_155192 [Bipolaris maydis ATCC 48331]